MEVNTKSWYNFKGLGVAAAVSSINASPFSGDSEFELEKFPSMHKAHIPSLSMT